MDKQPVIYGNGEQVRCFSDIDDCIYCLDKLITDPKIKSQILNIGPDEEFVSINKLYQIISNKLQFNKEAKYSKNRPNEVKNAVCSSDKARKLLNYETKVRLNDSLEKLINFIQEKRSKKFKYSYNLEIDNQTLPQLGKIRILNKIHRNFIFTYQFIYVFVCCLVIIAKV